MSRLREHGYTVELVTAREARAIEPNVDPSLAGLLLYPLSAQANPRRATRAFAAAASAAGARVLTGHEVTAIDPGRRYRISTSRDTFEAETLVLAAGAWCASLGAMLDLQSQGLAERRGPGAR